MSHDLSVQMRLGLAVAGISLDEVVPRIAPPPAPAPYVADRAAIRAELKQRGATTAQLAWLVPSCPSLQAARSFTPLKKLTA